jgi:hypothetical protein
VATPGERQVDDAERIGWLAGVVTKNIHGVGRHAAWLKAGLTAPA